ncbi:UNVERIFIED_CONTAM: Liprin-beta-2 [Gekko kuhli]
MSQVNHPASVSNETYQERLSRLEGDKESLILQVSVLTDQVEAQGEKIRDLEVCLEGHQLKLNATEEMLQQQISVTWFEIWHASNTETAGFE